MINGFEFNEGLAGITPLDKLSANEVTIPDQELNRSLEIGTMEAPNEIEKNLEGYNSLPDEILNKSIEQKRADEGLSVEDKERIKVETGWSDEIVDNIKNVDEAQVYIDANLKEVNGNLERQDIDWTQKIPEDRIERMRSLYGDDVAERWKDKTNLDLIKEGKAPYGPDGKQINLHHIGQKADSPLAELTDTEHKTYDGVLHDKTKDSEIDRTVFRDERQKYWQARYEEIQKENINH